jgi:hypothetical protein
MRFRARIELGGVARLGSSKRPAVRVTISGHTYRSTVASMGGRFMPPVSADVRAGAGVAAGDQVDVDMELDTEPREVAVPPDFTCALSPDPTAMRFFEGLSYSNKLRLVISIEDAKTSETRERRIAKSVSMLREGRH